MWNMINGKYNFVILFELTDVLTSVTYNQFSIKEMLSTAIKFHFQIVLTHQSYTVCGFLTNTIFETKKTFLTFVS